MKGRSDGVDAGGRVLDFPASDNLCGMENELFALTCLLKTYGSGTVLRNEMKWNGELPVLYFYILFGSWWFAP